MTIQQIFLGFGGRPHLEGSLFTMGKDITGQLGWGAGGDKSEPVQVGSDLWSSVDGSGAYKNFGAIRADGTLHTWGQGTNGALGLGNTTTYSSPKQVGAQTYWVQIDMGSRSAAMAIGNSGRLYTWGSGSGGVLGHSNTTSYSSPVQVGSLTTWRSVHMGFDFSMATKTDGTLWMVGGLGNYGKLGQNDTSSYSSPRQIGSATDWTTQVCLDTNSSAMAISTAGKLYGWGRGATGVHGNSTETDYSLPNQSGSLTTWQKVVCFNFARVAIKTDNTIWSWGQGAWGANGHGNTTTVSSPVQIGSATDWLAVFGSNGQTGGSRTKVFAIRGTELPGELYAWGQGLNGGLGLGNTTNYSSPKQVGSLLWTSAATTYEGSALIA